MSGDESGNQASIPQVGQKDDETFVISSQRAGDTCFAGFFCCQPNLDSSSAISAHHLLAPETPGPKDTMCILIEVKTSATEPGQRGVMLPRNMLAVMIISSAVTKIKEIGLAGPVTLFAADLFHLEQIECSKNESSYSLSETSFSTFWVFGGGKKLSPVLFCPSSLPTQGALLWRSGRLLHLLKQKSTQPSLPRLTEFPHFACTMPLPKCTIIFIIGGLSV